MGMETKFGQTIAFASGAELAEFIAQNRDAINASLAIAFEDIRRGRSRILTIDDVIALGAGKHEKRQIAF
jgi:hypothetical protein